MIPVSKLCALWGFIRFLFFFQTNERSYYVHSSFEALCFSSFQSHWYVRAGMNAVCSSLLFINKKNFNFVLYPHFDVIKSVSLWWFGIDSNPLIWHCTDFDTIWEPRTCDRLDPGCLGGGVHARPRESSNCLQMECWPVGGVCVVSEMFNCATLSLSW